MLLTEPGLVIVVFGGLRITKVIIEVVVCTRIMIIDVLMVPRRPIVCRGLKKEKLCHETFPEPLHL
jgi:hypothetical protein